MVWLELLYRLWLIGNGLAAFEHPESEVHFLAYDLLRYMGM